MDVSMYAVGAKTDCGIPPFQHTWSKEEAGKHINWLEHRAAGYALLELVSPWDIVQLHINNMTAIAFIRRLGGTHSQPLCKESHQLW